MTTNRRMWANAVIRALAAETDVIRLDMMASGGVDVAKVRLAHLLTKYIEIVKHRPFEFEQQMKVAKKVMQEEAKDNEVSLKISVYKSELYLLRAIAESVREYIEHHDRVPMEDFMANIITIPAIRFTQKADDSFSKLLQDKDYISSLYQSMREASEAHEKWCDEFDRPWEDVKK